MISPTAMVGDQDHELAEILGALGLTDQVHRTTNAPRTPTRDCRYVIARNPDVVHGRDYFVVPAWQWGGTGITYAEAVGTLLERARPDAVVRVVGETNDGGAVTVDDLIFELTNLASVSARYVEKLGRLTAGFVEPRYKEIADDGNERDIRLGRMLAPIHDPVIWTLMAPGGHGKTAWARNLTVALARAAGSSPSLEHPFPIFVEYTRNLTGVDFEHLLNNFAAAWGGDRNTLAAIEHLLKRGRAVLIVDGFDELAATVGLGVARNALRESLRRAAEGYGRAIVTTREHFLGFIAEGGVTGDSDVHEHRARLKPPPVDRILEVRLRRSLLDEERALLRRVRRDLGRLGESPLVAEWLGESVAADEGHAPRDADLRFAFDFFNWYVHNSCERELTKPAAQAVRTISVDEQLLWLREVAKYMLSSRTYQITEVHIEDLIAVVTLCLDASGVEFDLNDEQALVRLLQHTLFSDESEPSRAREKRLAFRHASLRDFFLAFVFRIDPATPLDFGGIDRPPLDFARFVAELVLDDRVPEVQARDAIKLCEAQANPGAWRRTLALTALVSSTLEQASTAERRSWLMRLCSSLNREDLSGWEIHRVDLSHMSLRGATLQGTRFVECDLAGADLSRTLLEDTSFLRCDLTGASFDAATFRSGRIGHPGMQEVRLPVMTGTELRDALVSESSGVRVTERAG